LLEDEQHSHVTTQHALAIESARIVAMASQHQVALLARTRQLARKQLSLNRLQSRLEGCEFSLAQHVTSHLRDVAAVKLADRARADAELLTAQLEAAQHIYASAYNEVLSWAVSTLLKLDGTGTRDLGVEGTESMPQRGCTHWVLFGWPGYHLPPVSACLLPLRACAFRRSSAQTGLNNGGLGGSRVERIEACRCAEYHALSNSHSCTLTLQQIQQQIRRRPKIL